MPLGRSQGYDAVELQHPDSDRPPITGQYSRRTSYDTTQEGDYDAKSYHSTTPFGDPPSYPPLPSQTKASKHVHMPDEGTHQQPVDRYEGLPYSSSSQTRPHNPRNSSWDLLAGVQKFEHGYEEFDARKVSEAHLQFAEGDIPQNKLVRFYHYLLSFSIVTRWMLFIVPMLAILWIPGILSLTRFPNAEVWTVRLVWWSIWLSVAWGGWWAALAVSRMAPPVFRGTVGLVAVGTRRYIDWFAALERYVAFFGWSLTIWITFVPLIISREHVNSPSTDRSISILSLIGKLLFALFLCAAVLLGEKFAIQYIAGKFHERSYADRIADQKFAVKVLVTLYRNSSDIPGRSDTLSAAHGSSKSSVLDPRRFFKRALKGVRVAATTTTTAFGNVASEIAGSSVLQPNSPAAMVQTALQSANKTRLLARRLYYSFSKPESTHLYLEDIAKFFPDQATATAAYTLFDKDTNGDITRDELELACMDIHREQLSIEHSMQDMDSAVGRLDSLLMSVYYIVAILIIAVALEAQLVTLVTGAGSLILGLSWLIGGSLQEVLTSIIFLFVKHPFDVGDRVNIVKDSYTVKEIRLLSTIFLDGQGCLVQAPNSILNTAYIQNIRRSGQMSETFPFEVAYETTFEQLELLRDKMLIFLKTERRDYQPSFDVVVVDFPEQESMSVKADIKYKSNWQQGALKATRRNKWICALKKALADSKIYGPKGNPKVPPPPDRVTLVPWDEVQEEERQEMTTDSASSIKGPLAPKDGFNLLDKNAAIIDDGDVFGETDELHMTNPRRGLQPPGLRQRPSAASSTATAPRLVQPPPAAFAAAESIEMTPQSDSGA